MYVRTFEADTLDDALKSIKQELGPDAIILKTVTNKGLKGAFKKSKIEITAAISEKNYKDKMEVDQVLTDDQRQQFYQGPSSYVSNMIDQHAGNRGSGPESPSGYGKLGLNRTVTDVGNQGAVEVRSSATPSLEDFLQGSDVPVAHTNRESNPQNVQDEKVDILDRELGFQTAMPMNSTSMLDSEERVITERVDDQLLDGERRRIDQLEQKLLCLQQGLSEVEQRAPMGIYQLQTTLRSLDITERYIKILTDKMLFNLSEDEVADAEVTFEYALTDMAEQIKVAMPLFSSVNLEQDSCVTMLLSGVGAGQSSTLMKLGALKREESVVIKYSTQPSETQKNFAAKLFDIKVINVTGQAEVMLECRKAVDSGKSVFIDYENGNSEYNDVKKFVNGLKRSFDQVEVLICLSAIHSELYNRQVVANHRSLADGMVVSHLDLCLNFGSLFNLAYENSSLPFKFYGTGTVVPDDLEAASNERILAGIFNIN
ncbi:MAG: hypothetical protein HN353_10155 [Bdellovibrionales bacterium]|jgi:flagellar biosynthesis protein FlhF|nr:hypothetical protein [Bdellovibrionales bacterium]MBT3527263.1 hypothetical protein [Bdellovibrionales bacterium]MBT7767160.1 hypothetical protein [Bdellovibrionales bacterium]